MKNKDLIRVLQALDPEQEVTFSLGSGVESAHRTMCAKAELMKGKCLKYLNVSGINITMDETDQSVAIADVILFCDNYPDKLLEETAKMYDEEVGKNRVWHELESMTGLRPPKDGSDFLVKGHEVGDTDPYYWVFRYDSTRQLYVDSNTGNTVSDYGRHNLRITHWSYIEDLTHIKN